MNLQTTQAVVFAGGDGTRMPPLVSPDFPKALLTIANRPMIFYSLYSLLRADFQKATVVVQSHFADLISSYCDDKFHQDPAVIALGKQNLQISFFSRHPDWGTADVLRHINLFTHDVLVLSSDYLGDLSFNDAIQAHHQSNAMCTVTLVESAAPKQPQIPPVNDKPKGAKGTKPSKKNTSTKQDAPHFIIDHYALLNDQNRILGLYAKSDISDGILKVRAPLISRYPNLRLRSDLFDAHIYLFNAPTLSNLLQSNTNISSVKYDLVPYIARRQQAISKTANKENWTHPSEEVRICAHIVNHTAFVKRANTVSEFHAANMQVATGRLNKFVTTGDRDTANEPNLPFVTAGERVSVTPDSLVGKNVTAGDRTSVKKSVVGDDSVLASKVKINRCVVLADVSIEEGANLAGSVVCNGAVIGKKCTLKDCRVAKDVVVEEGTEASNRDFSQKQADGGDDGFEFA